MRLMHVKLHLRLHAVGYNRMRRFDQTISGIRGEPWSMRRTQV